MNFCGKPLHNQVAFRISDSFYTILDARNLLIHSPNHETLWAPFAQLFRPSFTSQTCGAVNANAPYSPQSTPKVEPKIIKNQYKFDQSWDNFKGGSMISSSPKLMQSEKKTSQAHPPKLPGSAVFSNMFVPPLPCTAGSLANNTVQYRFLALNVGLRIITQPL